MRPVARTDITHLSPKPDLRICGLLAGRAGPRPGAFPRLAVLSGRLAEGGLGLVQQGLGI